MREETSDSIAFISARHFPLLTERWQQAGLVSFAYRLAHFQLSRGVAIAAVSALFYLT